MQKKSWILNTLPNGVTHLTMLLIDIKILQNRAEKNSWILNTLPNGVTHLIMLLINIKIIQNRAGKNHEF